MTRRIGVIAALADEAAAFFPHQGVTTGGVRAHAHADHDLRIQVCGVGKVNAAMAAAQLIALHQCNLLLVIGTAGKLTAREGQVFWVSATVQHDYGAQRADGFTRYTAGSWPIGPASLTPFAAIVDPGTGLPHAMIASGDSFVECPARAAEIARDLEADLVDMETAAIAQVATRCGVEWAAIRAVSDDADGDSAATFQDNLIRAAHLAGTAAERFVSLL